MYWKGAALSKIEGLGWKREKQGWQPEWEEVSSQVNYIYEVDFNVLREDFLFLLPQTTSFERLTPGKIVNKGGGTYRFYPRLKKKFRYRGKVSSYRPRELSQKERKRYLALPDKVSSKVVRYAEEIASKTSTTQDKVQAVMDNFGKNNFVYTLSPGTLRGDYLEDFLFRSKRGYCEHYASATGILLRIMGIPARLIVGFHGGLWNPLGEYYILRNQDAHAWVEFWREGEGWQRIDPVQYVFPERISRGFDIFEESAVAESDGGTGKGWMKQWKTLWFAVDMAYYRLGRSFFALDYETQKKTLARWGIVEKVSLKMVLASVALFGFCGLVFFVVGRRTGRKMSRLERYYQILCGKLVRRGIIPLRTGQGPRDYCQSFEQKVEDFDAIKSIFDDYILIKYAGQKELTNSFIQKVRALRIGSH